MPPPTARRNIAGNRLPPVLPPLSAHFRSMARQIDRVSPCDDFTQSVMRRFSSKLSLSRNQQVATDCARPALLRETTVAPSTSSNFVRTAGFIHQIFHLEILIHSAHAAPPSWRRDAERRHTSEVLPDTSKIEGMFRALFIIYSACARSASGKRRRWAFRPVLPLPRLPTRWAGVAEGQVGDPAEDDLGFRFRLRWHWPSRTQ